MPPDVQPTVSEPLSRPHRKRLFLFLVILFSCAVPAFIFYATGYRYNFFAPEATIVAVGGMYISVDAPVGDVYVNEAPVRDVRIFRSASYIQNLTAGIHQVHVQAPGYHTWVKLLPVYAHIVTEAEAYLYPTTPQLRIITPLVDPATGQSVVRATTTASQIAAFASTTAPVIVSQAATSSLQIHNEFTYVASLFGTSTTPVAAPPRLPFQFSTTPAAPATSTTTTSSSSLALATTTITSGDIRIQETAEGGLVAVYTGSERSIPYYFCIPFPDSASTTELYSFEGLATVALASGPSTVDMPAPETAVRSRVCRTEIPIDLDGQPLISFAFMVGSQDRLLIHRANGVFVTELDDRSWQNSQQIYPHTAAAVTIDGGRIYIKDEAGFYAELLLTLLSPRN